MRKWKEQEGNILREPAANLLLFKVDSKFLKDIRQVRLPPTRTTKSRHWPELTQQVAGGSPNWIRLKWSVLLGYIKMQWRAKKIGEKDEKMCTLWDPFLLFWPLVKGNFVTYIHTCTPTRTSKRPRSSKKVDRYLDATLQRTFHAEKFGWLALLKH